MAAVQAWRTEPPVRLTQREFVLAALFSAGATARQAAAILGIQFGTFHKRRVQVRNKFAAAGIAAGTRIELERALYAHPTLVAFPDGTERLVRPFVATEPPTGH